LTTHEAPGATLPPTGQVVEAAANGPLVVMLLIVSGPVPVFFTVTATGALVVPTACESKLTAVGVTLAVVVVTAAGMTGAERAEAAPTPVALRAATSNVYVVPLVSPVTDIGLADAETVLSRVVPANTRTSYPVIAEPPLLAGAVQVTVAEPLPAVTAPSVGAPGTVAVGVTAAERVEAGPLPAVLVANTSTV